jgi:very-short-patch-repair endonuclease
VENFSQNMKYLTADEVAKLTEYLSKNEDIYLKEAAVFTKISYCRISTYLKRTGLSDRVKNGMSPRKKEEWRAKISKTVKAAYEDGRLVSPLKDREKIKKGLLNKFGVDNVSKLSKFTKARTETRKKNHEGKYFTDEMWQKALETKKAKHGSIEAANAIRLEKYEKTCLEKYGAKNYYASNESQAKSHAKSLELYGTKYAFNSSKQKETLKAKYGVDHNWKVKKIHYKAILAKKEKYQTEYIPTWNETIGKQYNKQRLSTNVYRCLNCNEVFVDFCFHNHKTFCPNCNPIIPHKSLAEQELAEIVKTNYSGEILYNDRTVLHGKEIDIYIPELKLGFELDGIWWHQNDSKSALEKTNACETLGIKLFHIWDIELETKRQIVEDKIKTLLGLNTRIFARKCLIEEITNSQYSSFCDTYHIQGSVKAKWKFGLFFNDELVAVASFGKSRFCKDYELLRYCSKNGISIIGGMKKLVSHFKTLMSLDYIISYADRRYTSKLNSVYGNENIISISKPNYYYFRGDRIYSRLQFQKHKLKTNPITKDFYDDLLTEKEICEKAGLYIIYDCGNLKYRI